jgi:hypothetical protein
MKEKRAVQKFLRVNGKQRIENKNKHPSRGEFRISEKRSWGASR